MAERQPASTVPGSQGSTAFRIVDCDVHERPRALTELVPYLEPQFRRYITEAGYAVEFPRPHRQLTAGGGDRADAKPADGSRAGSDIELLRAQLLDGCNEEFSVLCGAVNLNASGTDPSWVEFKTALMSAYNDWIVDKWLSGDDRLVASIHLNAHDPERAVREIDRLASHPRMVQAMMYVSQCAFGEPYYHPIYEAAQRHGLVLAMHPANPRSGLGWGRYYVEWTTCLPQAIQCQLASLVFNGVFEKFPRLKFIMVEGGFAWVPSFLWHMDQRYRELRAEVPWLTRLPSQMVRDQVRFTTQPMDQLTAAQLLQVFEQLESDELVCFSTDYPHWDFDSPFSSFPGGLPETLKRKIFRDNALRWCDKLRTAPVQNGQPG
ncbi:MAG: amidohydrolase family protein [Terracidiphilus sp.]